MRIAIVDNDVPFLRSLEIVLSARGHRVQCYEDPVAAETALCAGPPPELLLIDYKMPRRDGIELIRAVRPRLGAACTVAMITGHAEDLAATDLAALGVARVLSKPVDLPGLQAWIEAGARGPAAHNGVNGGLKSGRSLENGRRKNDA